MSDTNVIIHIFQGSALEEKGEFYKKKEEGISNFKKYLLDVLGHVGISFPPEPTIYGFGPNITQEHITNLRGNYQEGVNSMRRKFIIPWDTINFLFFEKSPVFRGKIFTDEEFFASRPHIEIPLKLKHMDKKKALEILTGLNAYYGSKFTDENRENCLTAIFNHLPLYYHNNKKVVLSEPGMLRVTLDELQDEIKQQEEGVAVAAKRGGRKRRKTKRKKRKRRRTKGKRRQRKRRKTRKRKK